jgi:hypothetical protein
MRNRVKVPEAQKYIFIYSLFICGLFNDSASSWEGIALNDRLISE